MCTFDYIELLLRRVLFDRIASNECVDIVVNFVLLQARWWLVDATGKGFVQREMRQNIELKLMALARPARRVVTECDWR